MQRRLRMGCSGGWVTQYHHASTTLEGFIIKHIFSCSLGLVLQSTRQAVASPVTWFLNSISIVAATVLSLPSPCSPHPLVDTLWLNKRKAGGSNPLLVLRLLYRLPRFTGLFLVKYLNDFIDLQWLQFLASEFTKFSFPTMLTGVRHLKFLD